LALRVLHSGDAEPPPVVLGSSLTGRGLDELWQLIERRLATWRRSGAFAARRTQQANDWLDTAVRERLLTQFLADPATAAAMQSARERVARGELLPSAAARQLLQPPHDRHP
jgi:LAO/AO transport system kinase